VTFDLEIQQSSRGCRSTCSYKISPSRVQQFVSYRVHTQTFFALSRNGKEYHDLDL